MDREDALDTFAVGNAADGEGFVDPAAFAADHDPGENLDALFVAFLHPGVHADAVAHLEVGDRRFSAALFRWCR